MEGKDGGGLSWACLEKQDGWDKLVAEGLSNEFVLLLDSSDTFLNFLLSSNAVMESAARTLYPPLLKAVILIGENGLSKLTIRL